MGSKSPPVVIHWFRKGLRLHDNPALEHAVKFASDNRAVLRPVFILDTELPKSYKIGANRYRFLVESLEDLDKSFRSLGSRLFVIRGKVQDVLEDCFKEWNVKLITFENDTEPYSRARDTQFYKLAQKYGVPFKGFWSHTLYEPSLLIKTNKGQTPKTYQKFLDVMTKTGQPPKSISSVASIPVHVKDPLLSSTVYNTPTPTLDELNVNTVELGPHLFKGGETEALQRMEKSLSNKHYVENFAKPNTSPNSIKPSTTVLSPYFKFGCLSCRLFYEKLQAFKGTKTKPPVSLLGQLYWREFYYLVGAQTPNFIQMEGNSICKQIPWDDNPEYFQAWKEGRTGYPYIDAIMTQLRTEGWIHHLARHSVACFLTRGDLWQHWEKGQEVFEEYLLDADVYLNAGNWMWLSASAFFHQYYRVYSPIKFGQKTDPFGEYIRISRCWQNTHLNTFMNLGKPLSQYKNRLGVLLVGITRRES
ncbi:unnamed protein product [Orchesella dallaii]|uniref:Photolyase/cryptochrome alpha/beta domain-containing protein n=1 Tax=Orchesella dallaii TaxID=48710 RepID=A0ABP1Q9M6_9HEXA